VLLGVFGLVAFTLTKRNKEIAVRKVLGADAWDILALFLNDYAFLILIANIIAWPLAYIIINKWLENYAYRVHQSVLSYAMVTLFVFAIAFILIILQTFKKARANPVKNLRLE
jgi:putative ABC transport system permease protein